MTKKYKKNYGGYFIGGLLGGDSGGGSSTQTTKVEFNDTIKPHVTDILDRAKTLSNQGYQGYDGQRIADFTGDQLNAHQGIRDSQGVYGNVFGDVLNQSSDLYNRAVGNTGLDENRITELMNPYQQNVNDIVKREAIEDYQRNINGVGDLAVNMGSFGGDRHGIAEGMATEALMQNLSDIDTQGLNSAFTNAQNLALAEAGLNNQSLSVASNALDQNMNAANAGQRYNLTDLSALEGVGAQQQAQEQRFLDVDYSNFLEEREDPYNKLNYYNSIVSPLATATTTQTTTGTTQGPDDSGLGNAIGIASTLASIYAGKPPTTFKEGGMIPKDYGNYYEGGFLDFISNHMEKQRANLPDIPGGISDFAGDLGRGATVAQHKLFENLGQRGQEAVDFLSEKPLYDRILPIDEDGFNPQIKGGMSPVRRLMEYTGEGVETLLGMPREIIDGTMESIGDVGRGIASLGSPTYTEEDVLREGPGIAYNDDSPEAQAALRKTLDRMNKKLNIRDALLKDNSPVVQTKEESRRQQVRDSLPEAVRKILPNSPQQATQSGEGTLSLPKDNLMKMLLEGSRPSGEPTKKEGLIKNKELFDLGIAMLSTRGSLASKIGAGGQALRATEGRETSKREAKEAARQKQAYERFLDAQKQQNKERELAVDEMKARAYAQGIRNKGANSNRPIDKALQKMKETTFEQTLLETGDPMKAKAVADQLDLNVPSPLD